jgi:hypothetical protein
MILRKSGFYCFIVLILLSTQTISYKATDSISLKMSDALLPFTIPFRRISLYTCGQSPSVVFHLFILVRTLLRLDERQRTLTAYYSFDFTRILETAHAIQRASVLVRIHKFQSIHSSDASCMHGNDLHDSHRHIEHVQRDSRSRSPALDFLGGHALQFLPRRANSGCYLEKRSFSPNGHRDD